MASHIATRFTCAQISRALAASMSETRSATYRDASKTFCTPDPARQARASSACAAPKGGKTRPCPTNACPAGTACFSKKMASRLCHSPRTCTGSMKTKGQFAMAARERKLPSSLLGRRRRRGDQLGQMVAQSPSLRPIAFIQKSSDKTPHATAEAVIKVL